MMLTEAQEARVDEIVARFDARVQREVVQLGIGETGFDPDLLALDLIHGETDPEVADAVRLRLGVGVAVVPA